LVKVKQLVVVSGLSGRFERIYRRNFHNDEVDDANNGIIGVYITLKLMSIVNSPPKKHQLEKSPYQFGAH